MTSGPLNQPLTLPCGATLSNRIAKAGMSEHLGSAKQSPTRGLVRLYERWSAGGAGLMVTGGFRARSVMSDALSTGALDVVGMARPFTHNPSVAQDLIDGRTERAEDPPVMPGLGRLGGTSQAMMSVAQMGLLAKGKSPTLRFGGLSAVFSALVEEGSSLFKPKPQ
jgi:2,4-dienoyl-CoA reductase-like NADH-dependent reductase (Old Yellow Enzyme family)